MKEELKYVEHASDVIEQLNPHEIAHIIRDFKYSSAGEKIKNLFDKCSVEDKKKLYEYGKPGMRNMVTSFGVPGMIRSYFRFDKPALKAIGGNIAPSYRLLVHLGILEAEDIDYDEIIENIQQDTKGMKRMMTALGVLARVAAPEATPLIATLKTASTSTIIAAEKIAIESQKLTREEINEKRRDLSETLLAA